MKITIVICTLLIICGTTNLSKAENLHHKPTFEENLRKLSDVQFIIPDELVINRIEDAYRNPVSTDITPLLYLAKNKKFDFLSLVWASSDERDIRMMVYLLHSMVRDKPNLDRDYAFTFHSNKFIDSQDRLLEIKEVDKNLIIYSKILVDIIKKIDPQWAKILKGNLE